MNICFVVVIIEAVPLDNMAFLAQQRKKVLLYDQIYIKTDTIRD